MAAHSFTRSHAVGSVIRLADIMLVDVSVMKQGYG